MNLRPYQASTLERVHAARRSGARRILVAMPTGAGKTVIACYLIVAQVALGARVLVVGHRKELIDQFYARLRAFGLTPGILRGADERTDASSPVQLGTIQTLTRRKLPPADIVIVDECHRAPSDTYARLLAQYPQATVLGLTATPSRLDGKPLKEEFDVLVLGASYSELIDLGAIAAPIVYAPRRAPDLSKVRTIAGDYHEGELERAMMQAHVIGDVVKTWQERAEGRKTVVFAVGIDHSKELCARFLEEGVRTAHLDGTTPEMEREQILVDLELGKLDVVCNVGVLCEGWDQPSVKCCVMARPTQSLTLWMQCAGRILRPWGELAPILLDHSGNVDRHGVPHEDRDWSLDGKVARKGLQKPLHVCLGCYAYVSGSPCPLCGHVAPVRPRSIRTADGVLEKIEANIRRERTAGGALIAGGDPKRAYFEAKLEEARKKGFKPGYASAKWKEKFAAPGTEGEWPPWAWGQEAKAEFARDADWQARTEKRSREREHWTKNKATEPVETIESYEVHEPESVFDDLLA